MVQMTLFADDQSRSDQAPAEAERRHVAALDLAIDCLTWEADSSCEAALVFPGAQAVPPVGKRHNLVTKMLVKLRSGLVWCLEADGGPVCVNIVLAMAAELHNGEGLAPVRVTSRLKGVTPFRISQARPADLNDFNVCSWPVRQYATRSSVLRALNAQHVSPSEMATDADHLARDLSAHLCAVLFKWQASTIDQHSFAVAQRHPQNFAAVYRYLVQSGERGRRAQAAIAAPFFVEACALNNGQGNKQLLRAIDGAAPLLSTLERLYNISPATVRCLNKADLAQLGHWLTRPMGPFELAGFLDRLPADLRPTDEGWQYLEQIRSQLVEAGCSLGQSAWGQIWARDMLRRYKRDPESAARLQLHRSAPREVETMIQALAQVLQFEMGFAGPQASERAISTLRRCADACLWDGKTAQAWSGIAERWQVQLEAEFAAEDELASFLRDGRTFAIVPGGSFSSSTGERTITALRSRDQIQRAGRAMDNCLAGSHLKAYERASKTGLTYVVSIEALGRTLSTAELVVSPRQVQGSWKVQVAQHYGRANAEPSSKCKVAVSELVDHMNGDASAQQHIGLGVMARRSFQPRGAAQRPGLLLAQIRAFLSLGDGLLERVHSLAVHRLQDEGLDFTSRNLLALAVTRDLDTGSAAVPPFSSDQDLGQ